MTATSITINEGEHAMNTIHHTDTPNQPDNSTYTSTTIGTVHTHLVT